jgi:aspartyl-tRNA(Asn)/glutamyl-tRNA(Gln) amidotransferase subunit A
MSADMAGLDATRRASLDALLRAFIQPLSGQDGKPTGSGPLNDWTVAVKDNMDVAGTVRTDGLPGPHPAPATRDAEAVRRLRAAGARVVAKANLEELSFGATTQNAAWGACRNPWDTTRIPGGSSGGSAVAVAAGMATIGLGTDTGGSLRNPASFCGVTTIRPTHGLVPTAGVTPLSPSMDVVGPMARSAAEVQTALDVMLGARTTLATRRPPADTTVGVPDGYFVDDLDPEVARGFDALVTLLVREGCRVRRVGGLGLAAQAHEAMAVLQNSEAIRHLQPYWTDPRVGPGVRGRIDMGRACTTTDIENAAAIATRWRLDVDAVLADVDLFLIPTTPFVAPRAADDDLTALSRKINRLTSSWSLTGVPVVSIPVEPAPNGLPVGAQLIGRPGDDRDLLALATAVQGVSDWHSSMPPVDRLIAAGRTRQGAS